MERATGAERNWRRATGAIDCVNLFKTNIIRTATVMDILGGGRVLVSNTRSCAGNTPNSSLTHNTTVRNTGTTVRPELPLNHGILRRDSVTRTD